MKNPAWTLKNSNGVICLEVGWEQCLTQKVHAVAKPKKKSPSTKRRDRRRLRQWLATKDKTPKQASSPPGPADEVMLEVKDAAVNACDCTGNGDKDIVKDNGDVTIKGDATNRDEAASDSNQAPVGWSMKAYHPPMSIRHPSSQAPAAPKIQESPNDHEEEDGTAD